MTTNCRGWLFFVVAALLLGTLPATAQYSDLAPAGEGFAVQFPANPTFRPDAPSKDVVYHSWTSSQGGYRFFMGRGARPDGRAITLVDETFKADQNDVVTNMKATLLHSDRIDWPSPDGPLPALLFAIRAGSGYAEYLETIRGKDIFAIFVVAQSDSPTARDEVDRLVRTLRITQ